MVEAYLRQSPLAHLGLEGRAAGERGDNAVAMSERALPEIINLRVDPGDKATLEAVKKVIGAPLPVQANTASGKGGVSALWLGPDEWWLAAADGTNLAEKATKTLAKTNARLTAVGESRTVIHIAGPKARDALAKGCSLDFHPKSFAAGQCAQTLLAKATVLIHQVDDEPAYDVYVLRSFAEYLWLWLEDASREYGVTVVTG